MRYRIGMATVEPHEQRGAEDGDREGVAQRIARRVGQGRMLLVDEQQQHRQHERADQFERDHIAKQQQRCEPPRAPSMGDVTVRGHRPLPYGVLEADLDRLGKVRAALAQAELLAGRARIAAAK